MNDYKELIKALRGCSDATPFNHCEECPYEFLGEDCCHIETTAADAIEQLVKERDGWQDRYFEQARKCFQLEQELEAYAKAFRITMSYEPLMNHAVVKVDYNTVYDCDHEELMRALAYRLARTIEDARND